MIAHDKSSIRRWLPSARTLAALAVLAILANLAACWVIPWRMRYEPGGSYYTFAYISDEILYAQRIQPQLDGADGMNALNGWSDKSCYSQNFLEDALRETITAAGMSIITFFWTWRLLFPVVLAALLVVLARGCLTRPRPWSRTMALCGGAAAFAGIYFLYDMLVHFHPYHCWIDRVAANIDYLLSVLLAALIIRFLRAPGLMAGAGIAFAGALLLYVRPFPAIPWGLAIGLMLAYATATRAIPLRLCVAIVAIFGALIVPFVVILRSNQHSEYYGQFLGRCYPPVEYQVHPKWPLHLALAALMLAVTPLIQKRWRAFTACSALALAILPFICAKVGIAREMLRADRFGSYYNVLLLSCALLLLKSWSDSWRGKFSLWQARRASAACVAFSFAAAALLAARNFQYDFESFPTNHYDVIRADAKYLDGYHWAAANTPTDAIFLVDDGFDWSRVPPDPVRMVDRLLMHNDLFTLVARRRVVYTDWMLWHATSSEDLLQMITLQRGTFGFPLSNAEYRDLLKRFQPTYVFWRKSPPLRYPYAKGPIPRGKSETLKQICTEVYSDDACAIWKIRYQ